MSLTINHQTNDISNSTGTVKLNGTAVGGDNSPAWGDRGLFAGGRTGSTNQDVIDYVTISTTSNATDFGNLSAARYGPAGLSNGSRGVFGGGQENLQTNTIEYVTIASTGNATDFGDLSATNYRPAGTAGD